MNRTQAENILDAYVSLKKKHNSETEAIGSLREVILDAMTTTQYYTIARPTMPTVEPYKPIVTWKSDVETGQMEVNA